MTKLPSPDDDQHIEEWVEEDYDPDEESVDDFMERTSWSAKVRADVARAKAEEMTTARLKEETIAVAPDSTATFKGPEKEFKQAGIFGRIKGFLKKYLLGIEEED